MSSADILDCLPDDLEAFGDRPAVIAVHEDDVETITYAELADIVERLARGIVDAGIEKNERVALFASATPSWIIACLALIRTGAVPVPIDTQIESHQLERILESAAIDFAFTDGAGKGRLEDVDFEGRSWRLDEAEENTWHELLGGKGDLPEKPQADDVALLFYTSGTTGPPKGVPLSHRNLAFQSAAIRSAGIVRDDDRLLVPLPLHHVYPLVIGILVPLSLGLPLALPHGLTGPEFLRSLQETEATIVVGVPRLYSALVDGLDSKLAELPAPLGATLAAAIRLSTFLRARTGFNLGRLLFSRLRRRIGPGLRILASGGSPLGPAVARRLNGLGWDVAVGYGLTETSPLLTLLPPGSRRVESVGERLDGVKLRIDAVEEARSGDHGEILARGAGVFSGYLDLDDETDAAFTDDGWYRTGDLGRLDDDGYLYVSGRKSTMIVTASGENLRTEDLESHYAEHPLIAEVGILKRQDRLVAVVFPDPEAMKKEAASVESAMDGAIKDQSAELPSYQTLDEYRIATRALERTRLGKIKRHRLEDRYDELESDGDGESAEPVAITDMSPSDRRLLQNDTARDVWSYLAERYADRPLSPDSDFRLELGVDSLGWLDLSMDIAVSTGVRLDEADIGGIDTVRDLLETAADRTADDEDVTAPLEDPESVLSEAQTAWLTERSRLMRAAAQFMYTLNRWLMRAAFRVRLSSGKPPASNDGPLVFTPNHTSFLDGFALAAVLPWRLLDDLHWGGWTGYTMRNRVFRGVSGLAGVVPVDPERALMSSLAFAAAVLGRDRHLVWFPEGERSRDGELAELRPGIGALLENATNARVVPVHLEGAFDAWPRDRRLPRPRRIRVRLGEPLSPDALAEAGDGDSRRDRIVAGIRQAMLELQNE